MARLTTLKPGNRLKKLESKPKVNIKGGNGKRLRTTSTRGQGRGGRPWRRLKAEVHKRDKNLCQTCGRVCINPECDHIIPISQGGTDDLENLATICPDCHKIKTQKESEAGKKQAFEGFIY